VPAVTITVPGALWSELSPSLQADILPTGENRSLWATSIDLYQVCPNVLPQTIGIVKKVALNTANGATAILNQLGPNGNTATWVNMDDAGKCSEIRLPSEGQPNNFFVIAYWDPARNRNLAVTQRFRIRRVVFSPRPWISGTSNTPSPRYNLRVTFNYNQGAVPLVNDTIRLTDKNGVLADTIWVYCRCRTPPTGSSTPALPNTNYVVDMWVPRLPAGSPTRAPYAVRLHRANTTAVVAHGSPNVNWSLISV